MNYVDMKKQIERLKKELLKLKTAALQYERWQGGAFITDNGRFAQDKIQEIETACQALEMVLI